MRTVTDQEIAESFGQLQEMNQGETRRLMNRMSKEQPYIQVYVAAICEGGEFDDDNDIDAFAVLASVIWHAMRKAAVGRMVKVKDREIEKYEARIFDMLDYALDEREQDYADLIATVMEGYNQRPLLEFVLGILMDPDNPLGVTSEGIGLIFSYLKVVIDSLDGAKVRIR